MNLHHRLQCGFGMLILSLFTAWASGAERPRYAVMVPEPKAECTPATAAAFSDQIAEILKKSGSLEVLDHATISTELKKEQVTLHSFKTRSEAFRAIGSILHANTVIHGSISQTGMSYAVWIRIYDAGTGKEIRKFGASFAGSANAMLDQLPPFMMKNLGFIPAAQPQQSAPGVIPHPRQRTDTPLQHTPPSESRPDANSKVSDTTSPLSDHFVLGTRITHFSLFKETKHNFLGSINKLDAEQDYVPGLYAGWMFSPEWGLELGWEHVAAAMITEPAGSSDGTIVLKGPTLSVMARQPHWKPITPYAGLGLALLGGDFEATTWWGYGYPTPQDWTALGSSPIPYAGKTRHMEVKDGMGILVSAGATYEIAAHWSAELAFRMLFADADNHYTIKINDALVEDRGTTTIPFDSWGIELGIRYEF